MNEVSLPARGVWIEIHCLSICSCASTGHSPQGECGLKFQSQRPGNGLGPSLPARGVWIEIIADEMLVHCADVTPRKGSVD